MITLRTYGNLAEAGFAKSLLDAAGIPAELADENFSSIGYGPAVSGLRLQVDEADLERARKVLASGPDGAEDVPAVAQMPLESQLPPRGSRFPVGIFVAGLVAFGVLVFVGRQRSEGERQRPRESGSHTYEYDDDGDGDVDHRTYYRDGRVAKAERDRNGDGRMDYWATYDHGVLVSLEEDNNFDGKPDVWSRYEGGKLSNSKADLDFNGVPDSQTTYRGGVPVSCDIAPNGSKVVFRRQIIENNVIREELVDEDHDGKFDYRIRYDAFFQPSEHLPVDSER